MVHLGRRKPVGQFLKHGKYAIKIVAIRGHVVRCENASPTGMQIAPSYEIAVLSPIATYFPCIQPARKFGLGWDEPFVIFA